MKTQTITTLRVPPEITPHLIAYISNYGWDKNVTWVKEDRDSHTTFTCSHAWMKQVEAFVAGVMVGMALGANKAAVSNEETDVQSLWRKLQKMERIKLLFEKGSQVILNAPDRWFSIPELVDIAGYPPSEAHSSHFRDQMHQLKICGVCKAGRGPYLFLDLGHRLCRWVRQGQNKILMS
jgi:hypothetical protein